MWQCGWTSFAFSPTSRLAQQLVEIRERLDLILLSGLQEAKKDFRGRACIAASTVTADDLDSVVKRDGVEILATNVRRELSRHTHGTQCSPVHSLTRRPLDLGV